MYSRGEGSISTLFSCLRYQQVKEGSKFRKVEGSSKFRKVYLNRPFFIYIKYHCDNDIAKGQ
jgi:hypothetical protein